ncbi:MAG: 4Fe-4S dicluster domain-containing protein [Candidatus Natronoplasma sp.]
MTDYKSTGVVTKEEIETPGKERLKEGPVVVIECVENIPCDPCVAVCNFGAIDMDEITDVPDVDFEKCTGCALCVPECPGLAIFVIDCSYSEEKCKVTMPYEYLPVPERGEEVKALNRKGEEVQRAEVTEVRRSGRTYAVTLEIKRDNVWDVRGLEVER